MLPLVLEGRIGRMVTTDAGALRRGGRKDLGVGARARGKEQKITTESKRLDLNCSLLDTYVEILKSTDYYLCNTDEKIKIQNKVGRGQGCRARFGPQLPGVFMSPRDGLW